MTEFNQEAIDIVESSRKTHVNWAEFLKRKLDYPTEDVGDVSHHEECIANYDKVLKILRAPALTSEESNGA